MTVTKTGKETQEEENGHDDYKLVSNNLNGHVEDIYKMSNDLTIQKKVEVNFKMKTEEEDNEDDKKSNLCLPLVIRANKDNCCPLTIITNGTKENEEQLANMVANLKIRNISEDEDDSDERARRDTDDEDDNEERARRDTDDEDEEEDKKSSVFTERGPGMRGRLSKYRNHPYDTNSGSSPSSNSGFDSESSNSSPDTSPRHSISIAIPSRPHYSSVGLVTVVPPSEQNRGTEGESPSLDIDGRKRHSLKHLSGGGLVVPEEQPTSSAASSPHSNTPNLPLLTFSNIPVDPLLDQHKFVANDSLVSLSVPSPYVTYRDNLSYSPLSVQSLSDESLALASPASDFSQASPLNVDYQEQFHCSDGENSSSSSSQPYLLVRGASAAVEKPRVSVQQPFLPNNIDDLVSNLLGEFEIPDKNTDFAEITLCDSLDPVIMASLSCSSSDSHPAQSEYSALMASSSSSSLPPPPPPQQQQQRRVQRSPPIESNPRRNSKHDIQEEMNKIMKSFPRILPKLDPSPSTSTSKPQTNPSPPLLLTPLQPPKCSDAITKMRSMCSDHDRNDAIVKMEIYTIEELCGGDKDGDTQLHIAVGRKYYHIVYAIVTLLAERNRSIDLENWRCQTPLFVAVYGNDSTIVEYLLHHGANPDCVCRDGLTPLQVVASRGDVAYNVAKLLCDTERVDFRRRNTEGLTALHQAVKSHGNVNCIRIVKLFLQKRASLTEEESCSGKTALHLAVINGSVEMVRTLCENGLDVGSAVNAKTYVEDMPLHLAAMSRNLDEENQLELIKILLSHGANPSLRNKDRKLPRDLVDPNRITVIESLNL